MISHPQNQLPREPWTPIGLGAIRETLIASVEMPIPLWIGEANKRFLNKGMRLFVGVGPLVELEHVGRQTGQVFRTLMLGFRQGDSVVIALTYGSKVDWLQNLKAGSGGWLRIGKERLRVSAPRPMATAAGMARMPAIVRLALARLGVDEFVEVMVNDR